MDANVFTHAEWEKLLEDTIIQVRSLATIKGGEYAGDNDRLANFRRNSERLGLPMEAIWGIYIAKHWDSIMQYTQDFIRGKSRPRSESMEGRFDDLIVYAILGKAILRERERRKQDDGKMLVVGLPYPVDVVYSPTKE